MLTSLVKRSLGTLCTHNPISRRYRAMPTNGNQSSSTSQPTATAAIDFLTLLQKLKITKRTGWIKCKVAEPESIADHMYRMGMMSLLASNSSVDAGRCMRMALVHDVAEAIVGDITPHCKVSDEEKFKLESDAIAQMKQMLGPETYAAQEVEVLWHEYEQQATPESHLVKDFDKLEMILQAHEYEQDQGLQLQQFFDSTQGKFRTETGRAWAQELLQRRQQAAAAAATKVAAETAAAETAAADDDGASSHRL